MPIVVAHVIVGYLVATTGAAVYLHTKTHSINTTQAFLAFFCSLNALICFWELALAYRINIIKRLAGELRKGTKDSQSDRFRVVGRFFLLPCPVRRSAAPRHSDCGGRSVRSSPPRMMTFA